MFIKHISTSLINRFSKQMINIYSNFIILSQQRRDYKLHPILFFYYIKRSNRNWDMDRHQNIP